MTIDNNQLAVVSKNLGKPSLEHEGVYDIVTRLTLLGPRHAKATHETCPRARPNGSKQGLSGSPNMVRQLLHPRSTCPFTLRLPTVTVKSDGTTMSTVRPHTHTHTRKHTHRHNTQHTTHNTQHTIHNTQYGKDPAAVRKKSNEKYKPKRKLKASAVTAMK